VTLPYDFFSLDRFVGCRRIDLVAAAAVVVVVVMMIMTLLKQF
jgi:hypothetical protein